jgi:hypothetical protein
VFGEKYLDPVADKEAYDQRILELREKHGSVVKKLKVGENQSPEINPSVPE